MEKQPTIYVDWRLCPETNLAIPAPYCLIKDKPRAERS